METIATVVDVKAYQTRSGNTRYVLKDNEGNEYSTFKEPIARRAIGLEGRRARIEYHETQRDGYTNVYLDDVEPIEEEAEPDGGVDEVAWKTAVEAAPWLVGEEPKRAVPAKRLFEKLKPFKDLVAEDIEDSD